MMDFIKYSVFEKIMVVFFVLIASGFVIYFVTNYTGSLKTTDDSNYSNFDDVASDINFYSETESNIVVDNESSNQEPSVNNEQTDNGDSSTDQESQDQENTNTESDNFEESANQEQTSSNTNQEQSSDQESQDDPDLPNQTTVTQPSEIPVDDSESLTAYFSGEKVITINNKNVFFDAVYQDNDYFYMVASQPKQTQRPGEHDADYMCHTFNDYKKYFGVVKLDSRDGSVLWDFEKSISINNQIRESSIDVVESIFVDDGVVILYKITDYSEIYSQDPNYPCMVEGPNVDTFKILKVSSSGQEVFDIDLSYPMYEGDNYDYTYQYNNLVKPDLYYPLSSSKNQFMLIFNKQKYIDVPNLKPVDYLSRDLYSLNFNYKVFSKNNGSVVFEKELLDEQLFTSIIIENNKMYLNSSMDNRTKILKMDVLSGNIDFNKSYELYPYEVACFGANCPNGTITHYTRFFYNFLDSASNSYYMISNGTYGSYSVALNKPTIVKLNTTNGEIIWQNDFSDFSYPYAGVEAAMAYSKKNFESIIKQNNHLFLPIGCLQGNFWRPCFAVINSSTGQLTNQKVILSSDDFHVDDRGDVSSNFLANFFTNRIYNHLMINQKFNFLYKHPSSAYYKFVVDPISLDFRITKLGAEALDPFYAHNAYIGGGTNMSGTSAYYSNNKNIIYGLNYAFGWSYEVARVFALKQSNTHSKYYLSEKRFDRTVNFNFLSSNQSTAFVFGNEVSSNNGVMVAIDLNS